MQAEAVELTRAERWREASDAREQLLTWLQNATGLPTLFDVALSRPFEDEVGFGGLGVFMNKAEVKAALGARGNVAWEARSATVGAVQHEDVMKSAKPEVEALLRQSTRVLLYEGIRDVRDGVVSTEAWLPEMEWDMLATFLAADRAVWRSSQGRLAGYVQRYGALAHVAVNGAGHFVPAANRRAAQEMIEGWVLETGLFGGGGTA